MRFIEALVCFVAGGMVLGPLLAIVLCGRPPRYEYVGMNRERGFSIAFDRATGEIMARGLPGAAR